MMESNCTVLKIYVAVLPLFNNINKTNNVSIQRSILSVLTVCNLMQSCAYFTFSSVFKIERISIVLFRILSHAESIFEKCDSDYFIHNDATITTIQLCVSCFVCWNLAQNDLHSDSIIMRMLTIVKDFFLSFCERIGGC